MSSLTIFVLFIASVSAQLCSNPPNSLQVNNVPSLDTSSSGFKSNSIVSLVIESVLVDNRTDATITLNAAQAICNYPGSQYWSRSVVNCTEVWTAQIPWDVAAQFCNLARSEDVDWISFSGAIDVYQKDVLGAIRGTPITRDISTGFEYRLRFPKSVSAEAPTIQVFAPILVEAAVTSQSYDALTSNGKINLFTSVQYPFELVNPIILTNVSGLTPSVGTANQNCPANAPCEENFNVSVARQNNCFFTGEYVTTYDIICNANFQGECPLQGETATVVFRVVSQDLCGIFTEDIDLQGSLASFLADYQTNRAAFIIGQVSYWRFDVTSSKATIVNTVLANVTSAFNGGAVQTLMSASTPTALGNVVGFAYDGNGGLGTQARFRFNVNPAVFPVAVDANSPAVIRASVLVTYQNAQRKRTVLKQFILGGDSLARRQLAPSKDQPYEQQSVATLQNPAPLATFAPISDTAAPTTARVDAPVSSAQEDTSLPVYIGAIVGAISLCCLLFFAFVVIRRRRAQKKEEEKSVEQPSEVVILHS